MAGFTPDVEFPVIDAEKGIFTFSLTKKLVNKSQNVELLAFKGGERENIVLDYCEAVLAAQYQSGLIQKCAKFAQRNNFKLETELAEGNIVVKSYGVLAHASTPELGVNAIMQPCRPVWQNLSLAGMLANLLGLLPKTLAKNYTDSP